MKGHRSLYLILSALLTLMLTSRSVGADPIPPAEEQYAPQAPADVEHLDDVLIDGALCVGSDCSVDGFGAMSIQLESDFPTIRFVSDGSGSSSATDWIISTADSSRSYFAVVNNATSTVSLFLDSTGNTGLGTAYPEASLHISRTQTAPTLQFSDGTGSVEQNWVISAGQSSFALTDSTHGSTPIFIESNTPDLLLWLDDLGRVGVGGFVPDATLHVSRSDGSTRLHVNDKSNAAAERTLALLSNKGAINLQFDNTDVNRQWSVGVRSGGTFRIQSNQAAAGIVNFEMNLDGALTLSGNLTVGSCSGCTALRTASKPVNSLSQLSFRRWRTRDAIEHLMPDMAAFHQLTGLGKPDGIAPLDVASVALASVQSHDAQIAALSEENRVQAEEIGALKAQLAAIQSALGLESHEQIYMPSAGR